eukprot:gene6595-10758_t
MKYCLIIVILMFCFATSQRYNFTRHVGSKLNTDGTFKYFPGNTIIYFTPKLPMMTEFQEIIQKELHGKFEYFSMLPKSSFHMTLFDLTTFPTLKQEREVILQVQKFFKDFKEPLTFEIVPNSFRCTHSYITMYVQPKSREMEIKLRNIRSLISQYTNIVDNPGYKWHITLAYQYLEFDHATKLKAERFEKILNQRFIREFGLMKIQLPKLTFFRNMTVFDNKTLYPENQHLIPSR